MDSGKLFFDLHTYPAALLLLQFKKKKSTWTLCTVVLSTAAFRAGTIPAGKGHQPAHSVVIS